MSMAQSFQGRSCLDGFPKLLLGNTNVVQILQIQPELGGCAEKMRQSQSRVPRDGAPPIHDFSDAIRWYAQLTCQFRRAHL